MSLGYCYIGNKDNHKLLAPQILAHKHQGSIRRLLSDYLRHIDSCPDKLLCRHVAAIIIQASNSIDIDRRPAALLSVGEVRLFRKAASDQVKGIAEKYVNCSAVAVFSEPEWSHLPSESFDWSIERFSYHGLELLVLEPAIAVLDVRSPLVRNTIEETSKVGESAQLLGAAAAWLFAVKSLP